jgi:hypothetical protein
MCMAFTMCAHNKTELGSRGAAQAWDFDLVVAAFKFVDGARNCKLETVCRGQTAVASARVQAECFAGTRGNFLL